jgi:putative glycosyltransferase (TIGR04372 family)
LNNFITQIRSLLLNIKIYNIEVFVKVTIKLLFKLQLIIFIPLGLIISILIRLIRPWILIRICKLQSERIGHYAAEPELYLCEKKANINVINRRHIDIWYNNWPISNKQLAKMWARELTILPYFIVAPTDITNSWFNDRELHQIKISTNMDRDVHNLFDSSDPNLIFTEEEEKWGGIRLNDLGIPQGAEWICLHVRDNAYLKDNLPWWDWSYHDYRNCSIENYIPAIEYLTDIGFYVVRMGVLVQRKINLPNCKVIDYAGDGLRTEFMDIYLGAKCSFCISNGSGFDAVPYIFRKPILYIDHVPLGIINTFSHRFMATSKRIKSLKEDRFLTIKDIFDCGLDTWGSGSRLTGSNDYELVESTPEEIIEVVTEMESRLDGKWESSSEDEHIQQLFWDIFPKTDDHGEIRSRMGTAYLKQNM